MRILIGIYAISVVIPFATLRAQQSAAAQRSTLWQRIQVTTPQSHLGQRVDQLRQFDRGSVLPADERRPWLVSRQLASQTDSVRVRRRHLLAGLALLVVTLYLHRRGRSPWFTGIPMLFMLASTVVAMVSNLRGFWDQWDQGGGPLFVVGAILLLMALWLVFEAIAALSRIRGAEPLDSLEIDFGSDG